MVAYKIFVLAMFMGLFLIAPATPAQASDTPDNTTRIQMLEEQVRLLTQELRGLKRELDYDRKWGAVSQDTITPAAPTPQQSLARIETQAGDAGNTGDDSDKVTVTMAPSPKITYGAFSWQPFGRIHVDAAAFSDDVADHPSGAEFRRARFGVRGQLTNEFGYRLDLGFANEALAFKDVYLNYTGIPGVEMRVGHFKPPMGFEEMSSSNDITFIERAGVTTSFVPAHKIGIGAISGGDRWSIAAGVFNDDAGVQSNDDEAFEIAGRITGAPIMSDTVSIHLGASGAYRIPDRATNRFDLDANAENALQAMDSVSAVVNNAESATILGLEAAAFMGPVSLQAEYMHNHIDVTGGNDPDYDGYYGQLAWTITGEPRPYNARKGVFGRIKPARPFDWRKGHWGAWEVALRHSNLDLNDPTLMGGEMTNQTLGINWYLHDHGRIMFNAIRVHTDGNAVTPNDDPTIFLMRGQADF